MGRFIIERALQGLFALVMLSTIVFLLARVTGDPVALMLPPEATEEDRIYLTQRLGFDRPLPVQYAEFIKRAVQGDLGQSLKYHRPAASLYLERLPNSLGLVGLAALFAVIAAIPLGVVAGSNRGKIVDLAARLLAVVGMAAPSFWVGLILIEVFAIQFRVLPAAGMGGFGNYILPPITLSVYMLAGMTRLLRSSIVEVLDSDFVKLARIKGVSERVVVWKHCLRNSLVPCMTFAGMTLGVMIGAAVVVETIFAWPGVGRLAYESIMSRDFPMVQTVVLMHGTVIVAINVIVDVLHSVVDPRIRLAKD